MRYFGNPTSSSRVHDAMTSGLIDYIDTPAQGNIRIDGVTWCADNGCFSDKWDAGRWWKWLRDNAQYAQTCAFAVAPDVVGDAAATLELSKPWLYRMRHLGYRVAYVAQNGFDLTAVPWDEFDVLFIGGDDEFKLGIGGRDAAHQAKRRGKSVHMGRVNSLKRLRYAQTVGCDSVDGTFLKFGPDVNLPRLASWLRALYENPMLEMTP